jgi:pimeloyl-ACP methyl ester carboxylesterase
MKMARVNDIELAYEHLGPPGGPAMLLIHGSNLAAGLAPLANALTREAASLQLVRYHRRGMGGSTGRGWPSSITEHASDAAGLLDTLRIPAAHILGYSYGAVVALEFAMSSPGRVRSLTLLEPILTEVPSASGFMSGMGPVMDLYAAGDMAGAVTATFSSLGGSRWRELVDTAGPNAYEHAIRDTESFYRGEAPALGKFTLEESRTAAIRAPALSVMGELSGQFFEEGRHLLHRRFAACSDADIPDANHLLNLQAPQLIAKVVADFVELRE